MDELESHKLCNNEYNGWLRHNGTDYLLLALEQALELERASGKVSPIGCGLRKLTGKIPSKRKSSKVMSSMKSKVVA